jgi:hypothetical protein
MRLPREMAERRSVMRKCVFCSSSELVGEEEGEEDDVRGAWGEARAATVREAAVPLWAKRRRAVQIELRSPLVLRAGRARLSMGVAGNGRSGHVEK